MRHRHYVWVRWSEFAADVEPQGEPETEITYRNEVHLGLHIRGQTGVTLGMLGVRCIKGPGKKVFPLGIAIADTISITTDPGGD